jgi:hypothetical protein
MILNERVTQVWSDLRDRLYRSELDRKESVELSNLDLRKIIALMSDILDTEALEYL